MAGSFLKIVSHFLHAFSDLSECTDIKSETAPSAWLVSLNPISTRMPNGVDNIHIGLLTLFGPHLSSLLATPAGDLRAISSWEKLHWRRPELEHTYRDPFFAPADAHFSLCLASSQSPSSIFHPPPPLLHLPLASPKSAHILLTRIAAVSHQKSTADNLLEERDSAPRAKFEA